MKKLVLAALVAATITGCSTKSQFSVSDQYAGLGNGEVVTLENNPFNLSGATLEVGQYMPSALLNDATFGDHDTSATTEKVRIYSIMPSIDTPVCEQQAHELSEYLEQNPNTGLDFYAVSADTPFAQANFKTEGKIDDKVTFLSDAKTHTFGANTGTQIEALGLLTRSIIVVDKDSKILHIQRVPELTTVPDLEKAIQVAKAAS